MDSIVILAALVSAFVCWRRGFISAFLDVYVPVILLLPDYFRWDIPGLPDPTFSEAALLPIAAVFAFTLLPHWTFSLGDLLVVSLTGVMAFSEYVNNGYKEAQNFEFNLLMMCVVSYAIAKATIVPFNLGVAFAKRVAGTVFAVVLLSVYEFRFGRDPFRDMLQPFFTAQPSVWDTQLRWGFARIAGPYGSAILASIILIIGLLLQQWLLSEKAWSRSLRWDFGIPPNVKGHLITIGLLLGVAMTMSRGPWLSLIFAVGVARVGWAANIRRAVLMSTALVVLAGGAVYLGIMDYASVGRSGAATAEQETAAYRKELLDNYIPIAQARNAWGYGRMTWPKVSGMPSIDNYYLLLWLMHGLTAMILFPVMLLLFLIRLARAALRGRARGSPSTLHFTLAGCILTIAISVATVYLDMQVMTMLYLILGWSEGCIVSDRLLKSSTGFPAREAAFKNILT